MKILAEDPEAEVQLGAIRSLRKLGITSKADIQALAEMLLRSDKNDVGLQTGIVHTLRELGPQAMVVKDIFARVIANENRPSAIRVGAVMVLAGIRPRRKSFKTRARTKQC